MNTAPTVRPHSDRGQGRKPLTPGEESVTVSIRMSRQHRAKLNLLGGGEFVRNAIDRALPDLEVILKA